jgi:hypothetical protein
LREVERDFERSRKELYKSNEEASGMRAGKELQRKDGERGELAGSLRKCAKSVRR